MTSIEYYKNYFPTDLQNVMATLEHGNRISIHSFISVDADGHFGRTRQAFLEAHSPRIFLYCFFFTALIDQAIHAALREEHDSFEKIAGYPKFAGILSSYNHNMEPALLLLISTVYLDGEDEKSIVDDFKSLTDYFLNDYIDFFHNVFPEYTNRLSTRENQNRAIKNVFSAIKSEMIWEYVPKGTAIITPDKKLYRKLIDTFNGCLINIELDLS